MIGALAMGGRILNRPEYIRVAQKAAAFIFEHMYVQDRGLYHRYRKGEAAITGFADDYAFFILGLIQLFRATFDVSYAERALALQQEMLDHYWDAAQGGFFMTRDSDTDLPLRPKALYDGAIPSANSVALTNFVDLAGLTGDRLWENRARELAHAFGGSVEKQPIACTHFLMGMEALTAKRCQVVIVGDQAWEDTQKMMRVLNKIFLPHTTVLLKTEENAVKLAEVAAFTKDLQKIDGQATAHVCFDSECSESFTDVRQIETWVRNQALSPYKPV